MLGKSFHWNWDPLLTSWVKGKKKIMFKNTASRTVKIVSRSATVYNQLEWKDQIYALSGPLWVLTLSVCDWSDERWLTQRHKQLTIAADRELWPNCDGRICAAIQTATVFTMLHLCLLWNDSKIRVKLNWFALADADTGEASSILEGDWSARV